MKFGKALRDLLLGDDDEPGSTQNAERDQLLGTLETFVLRKGIGAHLVQTMTLPPRLHLSSFIPISHELRIRLERRIQGVTFRSIRSI